MFTVQPIYIIPALLSMTVMFKPDIRGKFIKPRGNDFLLLILVTGYPQAIFCNIQHIYKKNPTVTPSLLWVFSSVTLSDL